MQHRPFALCLRDLIVCKHFRRFPRHRPFGSCQLVAAISMTKKLTHLPEKPSSPLKMALFTERPEAEFPSAHAF